jgi:branched-chain amino acid transport system ATP-binding protein
MLGLESVYVDRGGTAVLRGVSITVAAGEIVALLGSNGSGKSTTLLAAAGVIPISSGNVKVDVGAGHERPPIRLLFQGGRVFRSMRVRENLAVATAALPPEEQARRLGEVHTALPLIEALWERRANTLSGGQRQVVALAMVLVCRPWVALLDEPFASIDPETATKVAQALRGLSAEFGTAILIAEHREVGQQLADRVVHLESGTIARRSEPPRAASSLDSSSGSTLLQG